MKKIIFKISGMDCTSCAFNIDGELEDTDGVLSSSTNYAKSQTEVEFDPKKVTKQKILSILKNIGYAVQVTS